MKHIFIHKLTVMLILSALLNAACSAAAPVPTVTSSPTNTPVPPTETRTPEPTVTNTPTQTSTPLKGVITIRPPANPEDFIYAGGLVSMPLVALTEKQQSKLIEDILNDASFSPCPEIWIEPVPDTDVPTFGLFINASLDDQNKQFAVIIRSSDPNAKLDGSIGMGTITPETKGKILVGAAYSPAEGQPIPDELEIQLIFSGCELHTERVKRSG